MTIAEHIKDQIVTLIDGDIVIHRASRTVDPQKQFLPVNEVYDIIDSMMVSILMNTGAEAFATYVSGRNNFRKMIFPQYKQSREDKPIPPNLNKAKEYMITKWGGLKCDGFEADDALCFMAKKLQFNNKVIIASIDKDLLQIAGNHYNIVNKVIMTVSREEAARNFFTQMLCGDIADDIPSLTRTEYMKDTYMLNNHKGVGPATAKTILDRIYANKENPLLKILELYMKEYGEMLGIKYFTTSYHLLKMLPEKPRRIPEIEKIQVVATQLNQILLT